MEATAHILEAQGLTGFTTNAVAVRAGISIGSLYQYFPSREALLAELIRRKRCLLVGGLEAAVQASQGHGLRHLADALVHAGTAHWLQRPHLTRSLYYAESLMPMDAETLALKQRIIEILAEALACRGVEKPQEAARDLAALTRGMADAEGLFGMTDHASLVLRICRAVHGYLGLNADTDR